MCKTSSSCFLSQLCVTALWISSSVTTLCVNPSPGSVTARTTVETTRTRTLKSAVSAALQSFIFSCDPVLVLTLLVCPSSPLPLSTF